MSILKKLNDIEIKNTSRVDEEDVAFCEKEQTEYVMAMNCLNDVFMILQNQLEIDLLNNKSWNTKSNNSYLNGYSFRNVKELPLEKTEIFIDRVINYFANKYEIALEKQLSAELFIENKYNYNDIIDYIYEQLNGLNFTERAKQDIVQNTKKIYWYNEYRKTSNVLLKANKITIEGYFAKKHWYHNHYILCDNYSHIFKSLYLFDKNYIQTELNELQLRYCGFKNEEREDAFDKYEPTTFDKLKSIKFFKNGKMELVFTSNQYAKEFAFDYLGYQENEVK